MKKVFLSLAVLALATIANAQCSNRYQDSIFASVTKTTVQYSSAYNLSMDIYTPDGDAETNRPAILLAHGGSFTGGSRAETTIVKLCERFAKRGYVTASMSYRLTSNPLNMLSPSTGYPVVMKAISDGKAAVRYLKANAATYGIDSSMIIVGGNSAGGILMCHLAWIDDTTEVSNDAIILQAINDNGGIEGNSGNPGPTSKVVAVVDWAGGIKDTTWISTGNAPVVSLHGDPDGTVPYGYGQVLGGASQITIHGPGSYIKRLDNIGITQWHKRYPGGDHQPWGGSGTGATFNEADSISRDFLYQEVVCKTASGINAVKEQVNMKIYPNPAVGAITVSLDKFNEKTQVQLTDLQGRTLSLQPAATQVTFERNNLPAGMYLVQVIADKAIVAVKKVEWQ